MIYLFRFLNEATNHFSFRLLNEAIRSTKVQDFNYIKVMKIR